MFRVRPSVEIILGYRYRVKLKVRVGVRVDQGCAWAARGAELVADAGSAFLRRPTTTPRIRCASSSAPGSSSDSTAVSLKGVWHFSRSG